MPTKNYYEGVRHLVEINSDETKGCEHCAFSVGPTNFAESINHFIEQHGYKLLHIGPQTTRDEMGNLWHLTVAIVGK